MEKKTLKVAFAEPSAPIQHIYANFALVNRNNEEIVIDFGYMDPFTISKTPTGEFVNANHLSRFVMTTSTAKMLTKQIAKVLELKDDKGKK